MLELTGVASLLRGVPVVYWLLALGALALAIRLPKKRLWKGIAGALVLVLLGYLPVTNFLEAKRREDFAKEAWTRFRQLCETKSGEKIYKTFSGVKSVLVIKPLPPATEKDLYDQFWYGDPYSDSAIYKRDITHTLRMLNKTLVAPKTDGDGFDFFELQERSDAPKHVSVFKSQKAPFWRKSEPYTGPMSRFGLSWDDISEPTNRQYWIAGSRFSVVDLTDNSVVAERIGFFIEAGFGSTAGQRRPWQSSHGERTTCPPVSTGGFSDNFFVFRVLHPPEENRDGK